MKKVWWGIALFAAVVLVWAAVVSGSFSRLARYNSLPAVAYNLRAKTEAFPAIDKHLNADTQKLLALLKKEYELQPEGTKYSEGTNEAWCADFVSWVANEQGKPFVNPNSGSWRIPGTQTLRAYLESSTQRNYRSAYDSGSLRAPRIGDIVIYDNPSIFGQHTNFVVRVDGDAITTVGGNENGKIRVTTNRLQDIGGIIGYAQL